MSIVGGQPTDEGPLAPAGSGLPRRQDPVYSEWAGHWESGDGDDKVPVTAVQPPGPGTDLAVTRQLPAFIEDSWSTPPVPPAGVKPYVGSRRAGLGQARVRPVVVAVLIGLGALVAIALALLAPAGGGYRSGAATPGPQPGAPTGNLKAPASLVPAMSEPAQTTITAAPAPRPGFTPVTLRADAASITRPARVISYPGASDGSIVTGIGTREEDSGSIQFSDVVIPTTGAYVITIYFVNLDGSPTSAYIAVSGVSTVTQTFTGTSACCARVALAAMTITAGTHTITIGNDAGPGPSIDKIVISRP